MLWSSEGSRMIDRIRFLGCSIFRQTQMRSSGMSYLGSLRAASASKMGAQNCHSPLHRTRLDLPWVQCTFGVHHLFSLTVFLNGSFGCHLRFWFFGVALALALCFADALPMPFWYSANMIHFKEMCPLGPWVACLLWSAAKLLQYAVFAPAWCSVESREPQALPP